MQSNCFVNSMTSEELRNYQAQYVGLEGFSSPVPLPFFYEKGEFFNQWCLPLNVEINVMSIVLAHYGGWYPLKAEPFTKRLWLPVTPIDNQSGGSWQATSYAIRAFADSLDGGAALPHIASHICFNGHYPEGRIKSEEDLKPYAAFASMVSAEINFASLLSGWRHWDKRIFRFIPPKLEAVMAKSLEDRVGTSNLYHFFETMDYQSAGLNDLTWGEL